MKIEIYSPTIRRKEMDAVLTAMVEEKIGPGERSRLLIQTAKEQLKFDYALALRSPAVALHLALKTLIQPSEDTRKKAVVVSALSPRYYLQVLQDLQITPLYCDITYDFPCMSRELIENTIAKKTEDLDVCAIVLHHTLGYVPDTASIAELGIPVIEDISQSYGNWLKPECKNEKQEADEKPGASNAQVSSSDKEKTEVQAVTFHSALTIVGLEERDMLTSGGGALLFAMNRKDGLALRNYTGISGEYCLPDINAALAVVQFKDIHRNIERRRDIAKIFNQSCMSLISRTKHKRFVSIGDGEYCNYSFSLILETGLKDIIAYAKKKEIEIETAFEKTIAGSGLCSDCPVSNSLALRTILLPMYPMLRSADVERISRLITTLP